MSEQQPPRKRTSSTTGLNLLDLADASAGQIALVQIILKKVNITKDELWEEMQKLPSKKQLTRNSFENTLEELLKNKWLWKTGEGDAAVYSTRLKRRYSRLRLKMEMAHRPGSIFTSAWQMLEAKATIEIHAEEESVALPQKIAATARPKGLSGWFLQYFSNSQQLLLMMLVLSAVNFFGVASIDVTGVSGFVETVGAQNLPWISIAEMLLGLGVSAIYMQYADRVPSLRLVKFMLGILIGVYGITAGLFFAAKYTHLLDGLAAVFNLRESEALLYPLLYLMRSQQIVIFPIAFWNLANNLYSMVDARRVFPLIASGEMIGGLIGYALFTEFFGRAAVVTTDNAFELLTLCCILFIVVLGVLQLNMKAPDDEDDRRQGESFLKNFKDGMDIIHAVPLFRYLALTVVFIWISLPILEYHFYASLDTQPGSFESFYSLYNIGLTLLPLLLQWRIVPALTKRVELRSAFIVLPAALVVGSLVMNLDASLYLSAVILLAGFTIYASWDSPMLNTLQYLVPEERRGRVGALLNNYAYAFGKIAGSLTLGLLLAAGPGAKDLYLTAALVTALASLGTSILVRMTYEKSMLSWRIARRARSASVFDKLDGL